MKLLLIGDIHFGDRSDSPKYNEQLLTFMDWACDLAEQRGVEFCIQMGDWYHHRNKINVATINYSIEGAKKLNAHFGKDSVWVLMGNHDTHFLHRLDVNSLKTIEPYVTVIDKPTPIPDNTGLVIPWITDGEAWDYACNQSQHYEYLFSHLELNGFMVNDLYEMENGFSHRELREYQRVLTGHYHSMQEKDNVKYVGTPLPITMNEANEPHGVHILDTDTNTLEFIEYDAVKVVSIPYDRFDEIRDLDPENSYVRIEFPDDLEDETLITDIQEQLKELNFQEAKIKYKSQKVKKLLEADVSSISEVENIDGFVISCISGMHEIEGIDRDLLGNLYKESIELSKEMQ